MNNSNIKQSPKTSTLRSTSYRVLCSSCNPFYERYFDNGHDAYEDCRVHNNALHEGIAGATYYPVES